MTREGITVGSLIAVSLRSLTAGIDEVRGLEIFTPKQHVSATLRRAGRDAQKPLHTNT